MSLFKLFVDTIIQEKRDNYINPENLYSTEEILRIAQERGDQVAPDGDILYVTPTSRPPLEYKKFTKANICITDPNQPDWGDIQSQIIPSGGAVTFIFVKSENGRSKKNMPATNFIVAVNYPFNVTQFGGPEATAKRMHDRGVAVIGDSFKHSYDDILSFVMSMVDGNQGDLMEVYDCENNLVNFNSLSSHLSRNGSSISAMKSTF